MHTMTNGHGRQARVWTWAWDQSSRPADRDFSIHACAFALHVHMHNVCTTTANNKELSEDIPAPQCIPSTEMLRGWVWGKCIRVHHKDH